jgi:acyl carrier protein
MEFLGDAVVVAGILLFTAVGEAEVRRRRRRRQRFDEVQAARSPLPAADFAVGCGAPADIAERVRRVLAAVSESAYADPRRPVDPGRLRPEDDLCGELGYDLDSLSILELANGLEAEFGIRFRTRELLPERPGPVSVGDVTRSVAERLGASRAGRTLRFS